MPQILNTRLLSPSLVRSLNPETYTFYCVYSEEEVNNWDYILEDNVRRLKHINICSNLDCQYYNRLTSLFLGEANNAQVGGPAVIAATAFGGMFFTAGRYTPFLLGWDTHGLPIEHKMLQVYPDKKNDLRSLCHQFALEQAQNQREQLKKLGLFTDYDKYYITLDKKYEAEQIRVFEKLTALAENEIEYYEKKDLSIYFKIKPWTIPDNQLVAVKKNVSYALVNCSGEYLIILKKKITLLEKQNIRNLKVEKVFLGQELIGLTYHHPYYKNTQGQVVDGEEFIQENEGTGLVHLAPAFGAEDFILAKKNKIRVDCPLKPNGCFNEKIGIPELVNKHYTVVNHHVVADLEKRNLVVKKEEIRVPIPVLYERGQPLLDIELINYIVELVSQTKFPQLIKEETQLGTDIMDVWLDSGVSHWCVLEQRKLREK
ncbi:10674_t:CDS:2 [Racocetra fulgida]|uniref:10674_t:CDS:1 n=1 Tax=Racocetra fulgida TaxID=60492 RepID=A0A9N8ZWI5_9GLOM|nr:10674_t:CDS:2 [Racocetra fulgida]